MNKRQRFLPPSVGGSSLLVIFAVLCLTVFALLSLSTVMAETRLKDASVKAVTDYYQADYRAQELFAQLRRGQLPPEVTENQGVYSYCCPISDTQILKVELTKEKDIWKVLCWQAVSVIQASEESGITVWDGETTS